MPTNPTPGEMTSFWEEWGNGQTFTMDEGYKFGLVLQLLRSMEGRPISEIPTDGTPVLLTFPGPWQMVAQNHQGAWSYPGTFHCERATHWTTLPPAPV